MRKSIKTTFWVVFALTLMNFAAMILWSMPALQEFTPLPIFDLRIGGYSFADAHLLLKALGPEGIQSYLGAQQTLDTIYPALLATSIGLAIYLLLPIQWGHWRMALSLLPILGMITDYFENAAIRHLLELGSIGLDQQSVAYANNCTILKFQLYGLAGLIFFALLMLWAGKKVRSKSS